MGMPLTRIFFLERGERLRIRTEGFFEFRQFRFGPRYHSPDHSDSARETVLPVFCGFALRHEERVVVHDFAVVGDVRPSALLAELLDDFSSFERVGR